MPIKILLRSRYRRLVDGYEEREQLREELVRRDESVAAMVKERDALRREFDEKQNEFEAFRAQAEEMAERRVAERLREMNISQRRFEQLAEHRVELVELYTERLYAMACTFAEQSAGDQRNRGLFILLIDRQNMDLQNFSDFHEGQAEYLQHDEFRGIESLPHVFAPNAQKVLEYMGDKELRLNRDGEILGYQEHDGAILVDLRGVVYKTRQMVEGVRTHKVYSKVERLLTGSARHNAALYSSSLDEVLVAIVVSEETNQVTMFEDGRFDKCFDPYERRVIGRDEYDTAFRAEELPSSAGTTVSADEAANPSSDKTAN